MILCRANAENRMTRVESAAGVPAHARKREDWTYLPDGRWIERIVWTNNGSGYYPAFTNQFVWDGKVLLAILNHTNGLVMSFMRGLDLSGSVQGAGGVGGVLAVTFAPSTLHPSPSSHFVSYDGNGNVIALTDSTTGDSSAVFEYGPFGELLRATGPMADLMPLRFSTMYADDVTEDVKYLFRDLRPDEGRWTSRDPIDEQGRANLYGFVGNSGICSYDVFGEFADYGRKLAVGKCEILILYGHGNPKRTYSWKVSKNCGAGAAIMCFSAQNSEGLSDDQNLWTEWGNEAVRELPLVQWDMHANGPDFNEWGGAHAPNANKVLATVVTAARKKAEEICTRCCCERVRISFLQISKKGKKVNPPVAEGGVPAMANFDVICP